MKYPGKIAVWIALCTALHGAWSQTDAETDSAWLPEVSITLERDGDLRTYGLSTTAALRDNLPPERRVTFSEVSDHAKIRTGNLLFDGLYAMAVSEALANSVSQISDDGYGRGTPIKIEAFQTGEQWKYVWTRDLSYSVFLALASFDPTRSVNSLLFKTSPLKPSVRGGLGPQIIQDTGSGGSYPVSTDRISWVLGASQTLNYLNPAARQQFLLSIYPILCDSIEQDRRLIFDPDDGLYRGEESFLDWREQTYPGWTKDNVLAIAMSKALSVNALDYFLLRTVSDYSRILGHPEEATRYARWAADLKDAINLGFFDSGACLYSTCLLTDGEGAPVRVAHYDLLGESLAILCGIADRGRAASVIAHYPVGPFGPPVVWPEEKSVPIYHNQAVWPFATAYWIKAARQAGNAAAVNAGVQSLQRLAARNLSNMENFDFVTGSAKVADPARPGPVIDSRRQLWSVAGYLSMVQDVIFGLDPSSDGLRFQPFITAKLRNDTFGATDTIEMRDFVYQGTRNRVLVHLPPANSFDEGVCRIGRTELNGVPAGDGFAMGSQPVNRWDIYLEAPAAAQSPPQIRKVSPGNGPEIFAPEAPEWNGVTIQDGRIVLDYRDEDAASFDIYRDGHLYAENIRQTKWTDSMSSDYQTTVHTYAVAAVDPDSGNISHITSDRSYRTGEEEQVIPAKSMRNSGGNLVGEHHFENWGKPEHELVAESLPLKMGGHYLVRLEFANGAGPVNTGITCAVKKLDVIDAKGRTVASGYLVMPQSGNWNQWDLSSPVSARLNANECYTVRIYEDTYSRNMSYLENNERYTAGAGGGDASYNYVNLAAVHLLYVNDGSEGSSLAGGGQVRRGP